MAGKIKKIYRIHGYKSQIYNIIVFTHFQTNKLTNVHTQQQTNYCFRSNPRLHHNYKETNTINFPITWINESNDWTFSITIFPSWKTYRQFPKAIILQREKAFWRTIIFDRSRTIILPIKNEVEKLYKSKLEFYFFATISSDTINDTHLKTHGCLESVPNARQVQPQRVGLEIVQSSNKIVK